MHGLELSKNYYEKYGLPMLREQFGDVIDRIAVGLAGEGSECLGYDDEISCDHDFEPGFCLWISADDAKSFGFRLERAYSKLPKEFMGLTRQPINPAGGNRHGVIEFSDFYNRFLGVSDIPEDLSFWLYTEPAMLLNASNGEVWRDNLGEFSRIRNILKAGYPEDVRIKKLAANLALAGQAGQYNYARCIEHGEYGAAQLAAGEFVKRAIRAVYLLNNAYEPFYKWAFRGMQGLRLLPQFCYLLPEYLSAANHIDDDFAKNCIEDNSAANRIEGDFAKNNLPRVLESTELIASLLIEEIKKQGLTKATCNNLETHAISIMDSIRNPILRTMPIMEGA